MPYYNLLLLLFLNVFFDDKRCVLQFSFQICFGFNENVVTKRKVIVHSEVPSKELAMHLLKALKHYFPDLNKSLK